MDIERHSQTWLAIEQWLLDRRADRVKSLINGTNSDDKLRGEIRLIDDLMIEVATDSGSSTQDEWHD